MARSARPFNAIRLKVLKYKHRDRLPENHRKASVAEMVGSISEVLLYYRNYKSPKKQAEFYSDLLAAFMQHDDATRVPTIMLLTAWLELEDDPEVDIPRASLHTVMADQLEGAPQELHRTFGTPKYHREAAQRYPES